jgi:hypothetical protein
MIMELPILRDKEDSLADRVTLTRSRAGVFGLGLQAPGRRISFLLMPKKQSTSLGRLKMVQCTLSMVIIVMSQ